MSGLATVAFFIISLFFSLVIFSLWIRIAMRYFRISTLNPLSQLIYTVTNPIVKPIELLVKQKPNNGQKYDIATFIVLIIVEIIKIALISFLTFYRILPTGYFIAFVVADLIIQPCDLLFYAILVRVIMSFVAPDWQSPIADFLTIITEPVLRFGRKIIPNIAGFDFSPFLILLSLKMISLFVSASLPWRLL